MTNEVLFIEHTLLSPNIQERFSILNILRLLNNHTFPLKSFSIVWKQLFVSPNIGRLLKNSFLFEIFDDNSFRYKDLLTATITQKSVNTWLDRSSDKSSEPICYLINNTKIGNFIRIQNVENVKKFIGIWILSISFCFFTVKVAFRLSTIQTFQI